MGGVKALFVVYMLSAVVRKINSTDGSGDNDMYICDLNGQPLCQSINYNATIHIELVLSMRCEATGSTRNDIQCDIDDVLNMTLADISAISSPVTPCTMLNDNGMVCKALVTVLDDSMASAILTQQLYEQLENNRSLVMHTDIRLVNADPSSSDADDVILDLQLWEAILILVIIVLAVIGLSIVIGLLIRVTCRCARRKQQPAAQQMKSFNRKTSLQNSTNLNYTVLETTDSSPLSPSSYEMDTFYPGRKKNKTDPETSKTGKSLVTVHQLHDGIDLPKLHEEFKSLPNEPVSTPADMKNSENHNTQNFVPTPDSYVKLSSKYSNDELAPNYINANYVKGYNGMERCYIVTHGPNQNDVNDFWQMVWEQKPVAIAMLQQRDKSYVYWPDTNETLQQKFGLVTVTIRKRITKAEYVVTTFWLLHAEENDKHVDVEHYWYAKWTTEQFPTDTSGVIAFLQEINETRKFSEAPLVVHCSDGLSCSGIVIAIDIGRRQLENDSTVDISNIVANMRQDRRGMILTKEQYIYIYQVLSDWTENLLKFEQSMNAEKTGSTYQLVL